MSDNILEEDDLELLEGAWTVEMQDDDIGLLKSVDDDKYLVVDLLTDVDAAGEELYLSSDVFASMTEKFQNNELNLMMDDEDAARQQFSVRVDEYKKNVLPSSGEMAYRKYLTMAKANLASDWRDAVMSRDEFSDYYRIEQKKKAMTEFVNDRKYEKNTPLNLRNRNQFVVWKYEWDDKSNRAIKVPYNPKTGNRARSDDKSTWGDFDTACKAIDKYKDKNFAGIGVMFGFSLMGIDIDHCIKDGVISDRASDVIKTVNSYTEYSPSGTGIHILVFGKKPEGRCRKDEFEMYGQGRFFTLTGRPFEGKFIKIPKMTETEAGINAVFEKYLKEEKKEAPAYADRSTNVTINLTDAQVLEKCFKSRNGAEFKRMYENGDITVCRNMKTGEPDHSACDTKAVGLIAYFTDNPAQIDRLFRQSALMRPKWDEYRGSQTYGQMTIDNTLSSITKRFNPKEYYSKVIKPKIEAEKKRLNSDNTLKSENNKISAAWANVKLPEERKREKTKSHVLERD